MLATAVVTRDILADHEKTGRRVFAFNRVGGENGPEYATVHRYSQMLISLWEPGKLSRLLEEERRPGNPLLAELAGLGEWSIPKCGQPGRTNLKVFKMVKVTRLYPWMADGGAVLDAASVTRICAR